MKSETLLNYWIEPLISKISTKLIGSISKDKILETAKILPEGWLFNTFGFECPLYHELPNADFLVSTNTATDGFNLLTHTAEKNITTSPVWQDVISLAQLWKKNKNIDDFWLEFDIEGEAPKIPSLFLNPLYYDNNNFENTISSTLDFLTGTTENKELLSQILTLTDKLPSKAQTFQIGAMRSRPVYGARLCINEISLNTILTYLQQINYPFDLEPIKELLVFLQPLTFDVAFTIDLIPNVSPKLGFECYMDHRLHANEKQKQWNIFIDQLAKRMLIHNNKISALKKIERTYNSIDVFDRLPQSILITQQLMGNALKSKFHQYLHHIKISYTPEQPLIAKAYIGTQHFWGK